MKGIIRKVALGSCLGGSIALVAGCVPEYRELVDPCWPERYNYQARQSIREAFNAQAANGHMLDQTIWNEHFEAGTAKLTKGGEEHLWYLVRRQPAPDPMVFVQWAHDAKMNAEAISESRRSTVADYLTKAAAARKQAVTFDVAVRDFAPPGLPARSAPNIYITPRAVVEARQLARDTTPGSGGPRVADSATEESKETVPGGERTKTGTTYVQPVQGPVQR